jgi:hypothetical protein
MTKKAPSKKKENSEYVLFCMSLLAKVKMNLQMSLKKANIFLTK